MSEEQGEGDITNRMIVDPDSDGNSVVPEDHGTVRMILLSDEQKEGINALLDHGKMDRNVVADKIEDIFRSVTAMYPHGGADYLIKALKEYYNIEISGSED